jgi:hypothetical protein
MRSALEEKNISEIYRNADLGAESSQQSDKANRPLQHFFSETDLTQLGTCNAQQHHHCPLLTWDKILSTLHEYSNVDISGLCIHEYFGSIKL